MQGRKGAAELHDSILLCASGRMEESLRLTLYRSISFASLREPDGSRKEEDSELMKPYHQAEQFDSLLTMIGKDLQASASSLLESALSALGYLLSGLWVMPGASNPLDSVSGHEQLMVALLRLLRSDVARVRLMALFVISSQCSPKLFTPHIPRLVAELSGLLLSHLSLLMSGEIAESDDGIFSQCASALVTVLDQDPVRFSASCPQKLVSTLLEFLLHHGTRLARDDAASSIKVDHVLLLRNLCAIMRSCGYDSAVQLLPTALHSFPTLVNIIKQLSKVSLTTELECTLLDFACDLWTVWLHILASLLHSSRPRSDPSDRTLSIQQLESARRKITSASIALLLEQAVSSGKLRLNASERKVAFYEFITPMNSVGKLVLPLNDIKSVSRARAARCYWMLAKHVVAAGHWNQPSGVLKILVRCLHYFLFILPHGVVSKLDNEDELWTEADQPVLQDVCLGMHFAGQALGELVRNIPEEDVLKVSVPLSSKATDSKAISLESILAALQEDALAFMSSEGRTKDAHSPRKRMKVQGCATTTFARRRIQSQKLEVWQFVSACQAQFELQSLQIEHPSQHFPSTRQGSIHWSVAAGLGEGKYHGLFSCSVGFRRSDILESQRLSACTLPVEANLQRLSMLSSVVETYLSLPCDPDPLWLDCISCLVRALCIAWQCNVLAGAKKLFRLLSSDTNSFSRFCQSPGVLGSQMFSQLSSSVYHCTQMTHVSSSGGFSSDEQVVLLAEHPIITSFVRQLFHCFAKIAKISGDGAWDSSVLQFHSVAVESLWWILHRTSTFQLSLGEDTLSASTMNSPHFVLATVQSAASRFRLSFPSLASTLVCCLAAITVVHSTTHRSTAVDQMMAQAIGSSINAITESGALPQMISFLHDHIVVTYASKEMEAHSPASSSAHEWDAALCIRTTSSFTAAPPHALILLVQRVIEKLAEMGAPSPSDQLSPEVLDNLLFGLRSLLILPVYLLEASSDGRALEVLLNDSHSAPQGAKLAVADLPFMQAYSHLISIWATLEQMHVHTGTTAYPPAGGKTLSFMGSIWQPAAMEREAWSTALEHGRRQCYLLTPLAHFVAQRLAIADKDSLARVVALKILASCLQTLSLVVKAVHARNLSMRDLSQDALAVAEECLALLGVCGWLTPAGGLHPADVHVMELVTGRYSAWHMLAAMLLVLNRKDIRFKAQDTLRWLCTRDMDTGVSLSIAQAVSTTVSLLDIDASSAAVERCVRDWQALRGDKPLGDDAAPSRDGSQEAETRPQGGGCGESAVGCDECGAAAVNGHGRHDNDKEVDHHDENDNDDDDDDDDDDDAHTVVNYSAEIAVILQDEDDDEDEDDELINVGRRRRKKTAQGKEETVDKREEGEEDTEDDRGGLRKRPRRDKATPTNGSAGAPRAEAGDRRGRRPKGESLPSHPAALLGSMVVTTESGGGAEVESLGEDWTHEGLAARIDALREACAACGTASRQGKAQALLRALQLSQALSMEIGQQLKAVLPTDGSSNA